MAAITKGITVSFANTPQAKDDLFTGTGLTEDSLGAVYLDVMANDLGGNAKTLYSLDDGTSAGGSRPADLLTPVGPDRAFVITLNVMGNVERDAEWT